MSKLVFVSILAVILSASLVYAQDVCADVPPAGDITCEARKANGGCEKPFMIEGGFCDITCGRCQEPVTIDDCSDVVPEGGVSCAERAVFGACNKAWLVSGGYCQKTCGYCFSPDDCFDVTPPFMGEGETPDCAQRLKWGGCDAAFMKKNNYCAKTCGFCGAGVVPEDLEIIMTETPVVAVAAPTPEIPAIEAMDAEMAPMME